MLKQVIGISLLIAPHTIRNEVKGTIAKHADDDDDDGDDDDDDDDDTYLQEIRTLCV